VARERNCLLKVTAAAGRWSDVGTFERYLDSPNRILLRDREMMVAVDVAHGLRGTALKKGDEVGYDRGAGMAYERLEPAPAFHLFDEDVTDDFSQLGGLDKEIARIKRHIDFRLRYPDLAKKYRLKSKCGILLKGAPGNGKTRIARCCAGLRAKAAVQDRVEICLTKNNVNFSMPDRTAWGQHEAYTCWISLESAARQLIPHLVSRLPYAGAGCLSAHDQGMGFELSQRARHMTRLTGPETMHDRAIFCTRAWKPSDVSQHGWTRTNLLSKDSQRCSYGMYLSYGVTGLLFMIMNQGHTIGRDVQLKDPLAAMRSYSLDPWMQTKVPLGNGKLATAIDIQRAYFDEAEPFVRRGEFPDWTDELLGHWSATLDQLQKSPLDLAAKLDPYLKLAIFDHQLTRVPTTWAALRQAIQLLDEMRLTAPESVVDALLVESSAGLERGTPKALYDQLASLRKTKRVDMDRLRFAVRLQALELNYHELGGLFDLMAADGLVDPVVVTPDDVERAIHRPPAGGRAEARSKSITEFHGQDDWVCDWQYVINHNEETWVDLRDPFSNRRDVTRQTEPIDGREHVPTELVEMLRRSTESWLR